MSERTSKEKAKKMNGPINPHTRLLFAGVLVALAAWLLPAAVASAEASAPGWSLTGVPYPTNFTPETSGSVQNGPGFMLVATNVGGAPTSGAFTITNVLPPGLAPAAGAPYAVYGHVYENVSDAELSCSATGQTLTCAGSEPLGPGQTAFIEVPANVEAGAAANLVDEATVSGGGAPAGASTTVQARVDPSLPSFGFLPGPAGAFGSLGSSDGSTATLAGSHPFHYMAVGMNLPTIGKGSEGEFFSVDGGVKDIVGELPRGMIIDPNTPVRCTEVELENTEVGCPAASQVGVLSATTSVVNGPRIAAMPMYNMVPPPGVSASFGFNVLNIGIYLHILGNVRTESDYGLTGRADNLLSRSANPVFGTEVVFWGNPSDEAHDRQRGGFCLQGDEVDSTCLSTERNNQAFVTLPSDCSGTPATTVVRADGWLHPGEFSTRSFESADAEGNPVSTDGCNQLSFEPTIEAKPTTNLADSPSGLDFKLHQPQENNAEGRSTANLKDTEVTLPEGLALNPSAGNGLAACGPAEIGMKTSVGETPAHFTDTAPQCPLASKLGSVEVKTPLLPEALQGSVYLAQPYQNPFNTLLSLYIAVESPQRGIQAKLPVKVLPDPSTGRLTATVEEGPELPLEDVSLHFYGGARGSLRTPAVCSAYTTSADLTPWSSPEGVDAHPGDSFAIQASPSGGACPSTAAAARNAPTFEAGTVAPVAGAYSPFVLKLSRADGSQPFAGIDTTLPEGLTGRLAGIPYCPEADIAKAKFREAPNMGAVEIADPSCPAASELGTVEVGAGAGPTPLQVRGHAYLAGPYKGAPLSLVTIVPAVAGPFDLGDVVVRVALHVDDETTRIHAVSDPFPQVIDGIPVDLRSLALKLGRPQFTLNPTSCNPSSVSGALTSSLGQVASLSSPFQVGGCAALPFKPSLTLRLKGATRRAAHPALIATLRARPGDANIGRISVALPHSEFLDQGHIGTVCTRVQFAAGGGGGEQCPARSVYGHVRATTPLLDYTLEGPVFLRSSSHELPDLVPVVRGPASQPIVVASDGRVDSIHGGLRNTFETFPDVPISKVVLAMKGGHKGLLQNSTNICAKAQRATVLMDGQNGKTRDFHPLLRSSCKHKRSRRGARHGAK